MRCNAGAAGLAIWRQVGGLRGAQAVPGAAPPRGAPHGARRGRAGVARHPSAHAPPAERMMGRHTGTHCRCPAIMPARMPAHHVRTTWTVGRLSTPHLRPEHQHQQKQMLSERLSEGCQMAQTTFAFPAIVSAHMPAHRVSTPWTVTRLRTPGPPACAPASAATAALSSAP
jgi:hypothetical protein